MSTPVYNQTPTVKNRPLARKDAQGDVIPSTFGDMYFLGDYTGTNLIYKGFARPGSATSAAVWQIAKLAYDGSNNLTSIKWPQDLVTAKPSNDYQFIWDNRAALTYS